MTTKQKQEQSVKVNIKIGDIAKKRKRRRKRVPKRTFFTNYGFTRRRVLYNPTPPHMPPFDGWDIKNMPTRFIPKQTPFTPSDRTEVEESENVPPTPPASPRGAEETKENDSTTSERGTQGRQTQTQPTIPIPTPQILNFLEAAERRANPPADPDVERLIQLEREVAEERKLEDAEREMGNNPIQPHELRPIVGKGPPQESPFLTRTSTHSGLMGRVHPPPEMEAQRPARQRRDGPLHPFSSDPVFFRTHYRP